jgi:hypothetical protein
MNNTASRTTLPAMSGTASSTWRVGPPQLHELPEELQTKYLAHKNRQSKSHPLYQTSMGDYGKVPRGVEVKIVPPIAGKQGGFSQTFTAGGATRSQSLITSISRSKFHSALD